MNSLRKQRGVSLIEIFIVLTASITAIGVAVTLYVQSNANAAAADARQRLQVLYVEIDRAYPNGFYEGASIADILATMPSDHVLRRGAGITLQNADQVSIEPGPSNNGLIDTAILRVPFSTTRSCVGAIQSTFGLPFDVEVAGVRAVTNGEVVSPAALADACDANAGVLEITVRASRRAN